MTWLPSPLEGEGLGVRGDIRNECVVTFDRTNL
jgi:hypothetical protein